MKRLTPLLLCLTLTPGIASAQYALTQLGEAVMETYDAYEGRGFAPEPIAGQLDADAYAHSGMSDGDLNFGETGLSGDHARGLAEGGISTGGFYAFDLDGAGNRAFGIQPGGTDWTPGTVTIRFVNKTGAMVDALEVSYLVGIFNDQNRSSALQLSWASGCDSTYTHVPEGDLQSVGPGEDQPVWDLEERSMTLDLLPALEPEKAICLRYSGEDVSGTGGRDEFALDNLRVVPIGACTDQDGLPSWDGLVQYNGNGTGTLSLEAPTGLTSVALDMALSRNITLLQPTDSSGFPIPGFMAEGAAIGEGYERWVYEDEHPPHHIVQPLQALQMGVSQFFLDVTDRCRRTLHVDPVLDLGGRLLGVGEQAPGSDLQLFPGYPNPSADRTVIPFQVATPERIDLAIIDLLGRRRTTLADGVFPPGRHLVTWNFREMSGERFSAGLYLVRLSQGGIVKVRPIILKH